MFFIVNQHHPRCPNANITVVDDDDDDDDGGDEEEEPHDGDDHDNDGKSLKNTTNKEPKKWGVWKMMFLSNWVIFRFQPFIFRGAPPSNK